MKKELVSMPSSETIERLSVLIQKYENDFASRENEYNEPSVRQGFILPLFQILGWDVEDPNEVYPEDPIKGVGFADFSLRLDNFPIMYIETKKFSESLDGKRSDGQTYVEQAMEYAWKNDTISITWAVLTNFKELRLYNAKEHKLVFKINYNEYIEKFDSTLLYLCKENVENGKIGELYLTIAGQELNEDFMRDLLLWRLDLANDIKQNNNLNIDDISQSVQKLLDRLILIRIAEDRGKIQRGWIKNRYENWNITSLNKDMFPFSKSLSVAFEEFESIYNTELFKEHLVDELKISNKVLDNLLCHVRETSNGEVRGIYAYDFTTINSDILGATYESYLGYSLKEQNGDIELIQNKLALQSGGIYYTRPYVVSFIVENTFNSYINEKNYTNIKILDNACGSGSFLIKVFDEVKKWRILAEIEQAQERADSTQNTTLSDFESIDIDNYTLKTNIFGVDIDDTAVEISKLNLWIKAIRKVTNVRIEHALPNMENNVKRGNSIINVSLEELKEKVPEKEIQDRLGDDWEAKWDMKRPFKYKENYSEILENGGFDIIVGNPPYNNMRDKELKEEQLFVKYFQKYMYSGNSDLLYYFIKKSIDLLNDSGVLGYIVARYFMKSDEAKKLRKYILDNTKIKYIIDTRNIQLFGKKVNVLTAIIILQKESLEEIRNNNIIKVVNVKKWDDNNQKLLEQIQDKMINDNYSDDYMDVFEYNQNKLNENIWTLEPKKIENLLLKIEEDTFKLKEKYNVGVSYDTQLNFAYTDEELIQIQNKEIDKSKIKKKGVFLLDSTEIRELSIENDILKPFIKGYQIEKFVIDNENMFLVNTYNDTEIDRYPNTKNHLGRFKNQLTSRDGMPTCGIYGIGLPKNKEYFSNGKPKIFVPKYSTTNEYGYDKEGVYYATSDSYVIQRKRDQEISDYYILAILNSTLMEFYHKKNFKLKREGYYEYFKKNVDKYPIKIIADHNSTIYDSMCNLSKNIFDIRSNIKIIKDDFKIMINAEIHESEKLLSYYNYSHDYGITKKELLISNNLIGLITELKIKKLNDDLILFVKGNFDDEDKEIAVVKLTIENDYFRFFFENSIKKYLIEKGKNKKTYGRGKPLDIILHNITVPKFVNNHDSNIKMINNLLRQNNNIFNYNISVLDLENLMNEKLNELNKYVFNLYQFNDNDISLVNEYLDF